MFFLVDFKSRFVSDPFFLGCVKHDWHLFVAMAWKVDLIQSLNFKKKKTKVIGNEKKMSYSEYSKIIFSNKLYMVSFKVNFECLLA